MVQVPLDGRAEGPYIGCPIAEFGPLAATGELPDHLLAAARADRHDVAARQAGPVRDAGHDPGRFLRLVPVHLVQRQQQRLAEILQRAQLRVLGRSQVTIAEKDHQVGAPRLFDRRPILLEVEPRQVGD